MTCVGGSWVWTRQQLAEHPTTPCSPPGPGPCHRAAVAPCSPLCCTPLAHLAPLPVLVAATASAAVQTTNYYVASQAHCEYTVIGCDDSLADNYHSGVTEVKLDASGANMMCQYAGCNDTDAWNFDSKV